MEKEVRRTKKNIERRREREIKKKKRQGKKRVFCHLTRLSCILIAGRQSLRMDAIDRPAQ